MPAFLVGRNTVDAVEHFAEHDWIEDAQLALLMRGMQAASGLVLLGLALLIGLSWPHAAPQALYPVLALAVVAVWARLGISRSYQRLARQGEISDRLALGRRSRWLWPLQGLCWGAWPFVFHGALPPAAELVCWVTVFGAGLITVTWMAAELRVVRMFLGAFIFSMMGGLALALLAWPERLTPERDHWLPLVLAGYGLLLWRVSARIHLLYRESIDLSYHNARLIYSLREQKVVAEEAARFKERFLTGAAHDLKQPVSALSIYAEWLSNEPELAHELGPKILQSAQAINALFDSLFDLVKLESGDFGARETRVDVRELLLDLQVQFNPVAAQKGLRLRVRAPRLHVYTDAMLLRRILINLLTNALRYTPRGQVLLAARQRADSVLLEVWDTGIGIAEHEQAHIYGEFYKVRSSGTEEGFGLGLAIVRRLSEQLGYTLTLRSRLGHGTVFRVQVPVSVQPLAQPVVLTPGSASR